MKFSSVNAKYHIFNWFQSLIIKIGKKLFFFNLSKCFFYDFNPFLEKLQ